MLALSSADHDHMVAVMRDRARNGARAVIAEARDEAVNHVARAAMPLDQRDLADIARGIHGTTSVGHRQRPHQRAGRRLVLDHADNPCLEPSGALPVAAMLKSAAVRGWPSRTVLRAKSGTA